MAGAKEDEVYFIPSARGGAGWGVEGIFFRDTVYFDRWSWELAGSQLLSQAWSGNRLEEFHCLAQADRSQAIGFRRELVVDAGGLRDGWSVVNTSPETRSVTLSLSIRPRFLDIFATRLTTAPEPVIRSDRLSPEVQRYSRLADDKVLHSAVLTCSTGLPDELSWSFTLAPSGTVTLEVDARILSSDHDPASYLPLPSYEGWRASFSDLPLDNEAVAQAVDDLRTLLLRTQYGPYPAAGMPIFVNLFGRDALITGIMILEWRPDVLRTVLALLAAHQGHAVDPFREEEPGKILHEIRRGELSRTDRIPFGRYYGSIDATPLFLIAAGEYSAHADDAAFAAEIAPAIASATDWLTQHLEGLSGLATFEASGSGLTVQSWKDSSNSMVDEHGKAARQPLAVAEVQGYAYAALLAAARMLPDRADELERRAADLRQAFHTQFWLPTLATYAMALDADMQPLRVLSSDPGHLLWTGIVPDEIAPALVETLMGKALWSGWGLRTLGANEVAYNPVSYHNGSVWPHDTGLFAMGLARYGFQTELTIVAKALLDLAAASPGRQMPELISGFGRAGRREPVPYTHANAPQAWSAATVVRMAAYLGDKS